MSVLERAGDWPVETVAVGVATGDGDATTHGATTTVLPWASVTKPLAAYAVLIAVDQGHVDLDDDAGPDGATVRHLLAHAAGYPMNGDETIAKPGERRIYSNTGFEVLGAHVAERIGRDLPTFVRQQVLLPLGMDATELAGSPAHSARGSLDDLLTFGQELLAPTLVDRDLVAEATSVAFDGLTGVLPGFGRQEPNDWGLGFEVRDHKDPHWTGRRNSPATFGHFGQSGSFLWVDPEAGLVCAALGDRDFGEWAAEVWPPFSDAVLDAFRA